MLFQYTHGRLLRIEAHQAAYRKGSIVQTGDPGLFLRQVATRWNDSLEDFRRGSESKDHISTTISSDFADLSSDLEVFPQMVAGL